ncbi:T-cell surface protein tactile isoform X3 [Perca fluviatilis]|uniref:T-cell surface protein tactile isoform X3 n=1 Tax=Perca fluviatilis TaxID=8168 RepID=UPI001962D595|nr:T-cell surface protein tactile isoform X3 [Perca fluviatilis]
MSLGSSNMAGGALGTAFSLLFLASIIQGLRDVEVFHYEKMEAVVGQNVTLPCTVKSSTDLKIVSIEWRKNKNEEKKLVLYSEKFGINQFWPNVTMQIENKLMGSHLQLFQVAKWDSGFYICDIATFPLGTIRRETELEIKDDVKIMCDMDRTVEVYTGKDVTIQCRAFPDAQYKWTKNKILVSENASLELWCVTEAHTGVYTLTVNTGNKSLHQEFIITVLTATTSLRTDLVTVSPQSNATAEGLTESADSSFTTTPTTGLSTIDSNATWTMSMSTAVGDDNPNSRNVTDGEHMTSLTNYTHVSVTSSPATHTDPYHFNNSTDQEINPTHNLNTSEGSVASNLNTTLSYDNKVFRSTQDTRNASMGGNPGATPTLGTVNTMTPIEDEDTAGVRSHLLLPLIIVPLIAVVGFLYRRKLMKERMDLPPPFKPPPPPVRYTAARHHDISTQQFPTSRCNSVTELKDMKQINMYIY